MTELVDDAIAVLRRCDVELGPALTEHELSEIERTYGFLFGPDHRELLSKVLPLGQRWVDWRSDPENDIRYRMAWPEDGLIFDVQHDQFWPKSWGEKPAELHKAMSVARTRIRQWPVLVPLYAHPFRPAGPSHPGAPIFSVYQNDIIYYGSDLADYFEREFGGRSWHEDPHGPDYLYPWSTFTYEETLP
jgi:hypothetical protein